MHRKILGTAAALFLVAAACGGSDQGEATPTTAPPQTTTQATTTTTQAPSTTSGAGPATSPAEVVFEKQGSDGTSIVVASVTLPAAGFIAVHGNAGGSPGPVVGHSDLLPSGTSTDVVVTLDTPLESTDLLFPMAHIDANENGEYEFFPPETTIDGPATTAGGEVAVVGAEVTVADAAGAALTVAASALGDILVDGDGRTLYLFLNDDQGESTCYDACASNWPPLTGEATAGTGVDGTLLGTTERTDGSIQVTYDARPLYYFAGDTSPGDTAGQGINDVWFVVSPTATP
jgi:predicted lipoprotein with Yx(FWY)xxD motif